MKILRGVSILFFLCIIIYYMQGWVYARGSILSRFLLLFVMLINIIYGIKYIFTKKKNLIGNCILFFLLINTIYWLVSPNIVFSAAGQLTTMGFYKTVSFIFLSYFPIFFWLKNDIIKEKDIKYVFYIMFVVSIGLYYNQMTQNLLLRDTDQFTNNIVYYFVVLLPFIGLIFEKKILYIFLILSLYYVMMGAKRGAIICMCFVIICFLYYKFQIRHRSLESILKMLFVLTGISMALLLLVNYLYTTNDYLQLRFELMKSGDSSGRDIIYQHAYNIFNDGNLFQLLFGYGYCQSVNFLGLYAHNDWLELLVDMGILGIISYLFIFISILVFFFKNKKYISNNVRFMIVSTMFTLILRSIFSMGYCDLLTIFNLIIIAICQISVEKNRIQV